MATLAQDLLAKLDAELKLGLTPQEIEDYGAGLDSLLPAIEDVLSVLQGTVEDGQELDVEFGVPPTPPFQDGWQVRELPTAETVVEPARHAGLWQGLYATADRKTFYVYTVIDSGGIGFELAFVNRITVKE